MPGKQSSLGIIISFSLLSWIIDSFSVFERLCLLAAHPSLLLAALRDPTEKYGWFFATLWPAACEAPLSMGFSWQEYRPGLPFPPPGNLPDPETETASPVCPALAGGFLTTKPPGKPMGCLPGPVHWWASSAAWGCQKDAIYSSRRSFGDSE